MKTTPAGLFAIHKAAERAKNVAKMVHKYVYEYEREIDTDDMDARETYSDLDEAIKKLQSARDRINFLAKE